MNILRAMSAGVVAGVLIGAGCQMKTPQEPVSPSGETVAPLQEVESAFDLADYRGRVVLLDFWATWCAPCRSEIPSLNSVHVDFKDRGVDVVGLSVDRGSPQQVAADAQKMGVTYPVVLADEAVQQQFGGVRVVPTKILVDKQGAVRKTYLGVVPAEELRQQITALLSE